MFHYKVAAVSDNGNESSWSSAYRTWTSYPVVSPFPRRIATGTYSSVSSPNIADVDNDGKQEIFWIYEDRSGTRTSYLMGFRPTGEELFDIDGNVTTVSGFAKTPTMLTGQVAFGDLAGNGEQNIVVSTWDDLYRDKTLFAVILHLIRMEIINRTCYGKKDSLFNVSESGNSQSGWKFGWDNGGYY